jgi:hypothetical protein
MFSDRTYHDIIGNEELENSNMIQIPRHYFGNIQIEINNEVTVYRILSKKNDNSFLKDWELTNIKLNVRGYSCSHTLVVKKVFNKGLIRLFSGGPLASSPIIIKSLASSLPSSIKINDKIIENKYGVTNINAFSNKF